MNYICPKCQTQYENRCPDGPECELGHPCPKCGAEVVVDTSGEVTVIEEAEITGFSFTESGIGLEGYILKSHKEPR